MGQEEEGSLRRGSTKLLRSESIPSFNPTWLKKIIKFFGAEEVSH